MKFAGTSCSATIQGVGTITFKGILDSAEIADETELGTNIRMNAILRVDRDVAKNFKGVTNQLVVVGGVNYVVNEPIFEDDGATAVLPIYPYDDDTRLGW